MKKFIIISTIAIMLTSSNVFAITKTSSSFSDGPWEKYTTNGTKQLVYGYNTFLIDEDYAHAFNSAVPVHATIINGNGTFYKSGDPGEWAKLEVVHKGYEVVYKAQ